MPYQRFLFAVFVLLLPAIARAFQIPPSPGVVIEDVKDRLEAAKAGLQPGDVVFAWARSDVEGTIASPFDLVEVEMEQASRGAVTLRGRRAAREQAWTLAAAVPGRWGVSARPALSQAVLDAYQQGRKLVKARQPVEALARWRAAADAAQSEPPLTLAWLLSEAGSALAGLRGLKEADELMRTALGHSAAQPPIIRAQILESWAQALYQQDWPRAEVLYRQALDERRKVQTESLAIAYVTSSLGYVARNQGDSAKAEEHYRDALAIAGKVAPGSVAAAQFLNNLGAAAQYRGELLTAEECYLGALEIRRKLSPDTVPTVLNNLGALALDEGDLAKAEESFQQSLKLRETPIVLHNLGQVADARGDAAAAEDYFRRESELTAKLAPASLAFADSLDWLGVFAMNHGDLAKAEDYQRRALGIREKLEPGGLNVARSLANLGDLAAARGDTASAEEQQRRALAIREKLLPGTEFHAESMLHLSSVLSAKGELAESTKLMSAALDILETRAVKLDGTEEARAGYRTRYAARYAEYVDQLLRAKQPENAFAVSERARARSLLAMIAERDLVFAADLPSDLKQARTLNDRAYDSVLNQINRLPVDAAAMRETQLARLTALEADREQLAERIRRASPRVAALQYPQPLDLARTRQALDPGTVLLSYSVGAERTVLFVVRPPATDPGLAVFTLPIGEKALEARTQEFRQSIANRAAPARASLAAHARSLYDLLLKPAEAQFASADRLLIVPDGPLHVLPFAALLRTENQYLVDWKPLHTVISATVYSELKKMRDRQPAAPVELVAFGDPQYHTGKPEPPPSARPSLSLARLPFSRDEVAGIAALFPHDSRTYFGADATEDRAKELGSQARYLHFATHAVLDDRFPLNSALVLTLPAQWTEGQENGFLQAWEIFEQFRLNADLVVLSACESGLGKQMRGEGLIGLVRAFQYAGARSILASLWEVDDRSTADLMKAFYGHLRSGKSKDDALRAAQQQLLHSRKAAHPSYWAAFSLIGDWQ